MEFSRSEEMKEAARAALEITDGTVRVTDPAALRERLVDRLVWTAVFAKDAALRDEARSLIRRTARATGAVSASIQDLYLARGRGEVGGFTVPAHNLRGMTYDVSRALFRAAKAKEAGAFIFEIARSEIGYTEQRPAEYAAVVLAAAIREGWKGPVFIQGDHFQANAKKMQDAPEKEVQALKDLVAEAVAADFLNIDIDCSTLVDLSKATTREQQRVNGTLGAELTAVVRKHEPRGVTISVGGEIGEVGGKNSTEEELRAYMEEYRAALGRHGVAQGISKVSVQTGTTHGGIPLPGGGVAQVKIDFGTLERLSAVSRAEFGMAGAVQHGASTLPAELFGKFPEVETAEIHLATEFQNLVLDHKAFPKDLREAMFAHCVKNHAEERKASDTDDTFFYKTRKKANGPFKREMWSLPAGARGEIAATLEEKFRFLMDRLRAAGTAAVVSRHVKSPAA